MERKRGETRAIERLHGSAARSEGTHLVPGGGDCAGGAPGISHRNVIYEAFLTPPGVMANACPTERARGREKEKERGRMTARG